MKRLIILLALAVLLSACENGTRSGGKGMGVVYTPSHYELDLAAEPGPQGPPHGQS